MSSFNNDHLILNTIEQFCSCLIDQIEKCVGIHLDWVAVHPLVETPEIEDTLIENSIFEVISTDMNKYINA